MWGILVFLFPFSLCTGTRQALLWDLLRFNGNPVSPQLRILVSFQDFFLETNMTMGTFMAFNQAYNRMMGTFIHEKHTLGLVDYRHLMLPFKHIVEEGPIYRHLKRIMPTLLQLHDQAKYHRTNLMAPTPMNAVYIGDLLEYDLSNYPVSEVDFWDALYETIYDNLKLLVSFDRDTPLHVFWQEVRRAEYGQVRLLYLKPNQVVKTMHDLNSMRWGYAMTLLEFLHDTPGRLTPRYLKCFEEGYFQLINFSLRYLHENVFVIEDWSLAEKVTYMIRTTLDKTESFARINLEPLVQALPPPAVQQLLQNIVTVAVYGRFKHLVPEPVESIGALFFPNQLNAELVICYHSNALHEILRQGGDINSNLAALYNKVNGYHL